MEKVPAQEAARKVKDVEPVEKAEEKPLDLRPTGPDSGLAGVFDHIITLDSTTRDRSLYPDSNSYRLELSRSLYKIEKISMSGATIPNPAHPSHIGLFSTRPHILYVKLRSSRFGEITDSLSASVGGPWFGQIFLEDFDNPPEYLNIKTTRDTVFQTVLIDIIEDFHVELFYYDTSTENFERYPTSSGECIFKLIVACSLDKRYVRDRAPRRLKDPIDPERKRPNAKMIADDYMKMKESHWVGDQNQSILPFENMGEGMANPVFIPSAIILVATLALMTYPEVAML